MSQKNETFELPNGERIIVTGLVDKDGNWMGATGDKGFVERPDLIGETGEKGPVD